MGRSPRAFDTDFRAVALGARKDRTLRWSGSKDRKFEFRKAFLPSDNVRVFEKECLDCHRHAHRPSGARISVQCSWHRNEAELDSANSAKRCAASSQQKGAKANAIDSRAVKKNGTNQS